MARPRKPIAEKLVQVPLVVLPATRHVAQEIATANTVSLAEILREAIDAGLPLVPKRLARRRRRDQERGAATATATEAPPPKAETSSSEVALEAPVEVVYGGTVYVLDPERRTEGDSNSRCEMSHLGDPGSRIRAA